MLISSHIHIFRYTFVLAYVPDRPREARSGAHFPTYSVNVAGLLFMSPVTFYVNTIGKLLASPHWINREWRH